jgi:hypothetical protein
MTQRIIDMYLGKQHQWFKYSATLATSTCTQDIWISTYGADTLEPDTVSVPSQKHATLSKESLNPSEVAGIIWSADGTNEATHRLRQSRFRIGDFPMAVDVVFGRHLIFSESIYSFNNAALVLTKAKERESTSPNIDKLVE